MYLQPLAALIEQQGGQLYPERHSLFLMIDVKTNASTLHEFLKKHLAPYRRFLLTYDHQSYCENAITIFLSGERPLKTLPYEDELFLFLDGRSSDIGKSFDHRLMPVVSKRYSEMFGFLFWNVVPSEASWRRFRRYTEEVHKEGKLVRMWASPEDEFIWQKLLENGADIINTDEPKK
ncbi:MAG: hypothetical protein AAFZ15_19685 [Bacteroidota bacterium]